MKESHNIFRSERLKSMMPKKCKEIEPYKMGNDFYKLDTFIGSDPERLALIGNSNADLTKCCIKLNIKEECILIAEDGYLSMMIPLDEAEKIVHEVNRIRFRVNK